MSVQEQRIKVMKTLGISAFISKKVEQRRINKQQVEAMAQDLAGCWDGFASNSLNKVQRRALQIMKQQDKQQRNLAENLTRAEKRKEYLEVEKHMGCNYNGPYLF